MLRQRERFYKRMVGLLVLISILTVLYIFQLYNRETKPFTERYLLNARLEQADGLRVNTQVTLAGIPIGRVSRMEVGDQHAILISLDLESRFQKHIRSDSVATLQHPMLGNPSVDISIGTDVQSVLQDGDQIEVKRAAELGDVLSELPQRLEKIDKILNHIENVTGALAKDDGSLNKAMEDFEKSMAGLEMLMAGLNRPGGTLQTSLKNFQTVSETMLVASHQLEKNLQNLDRLLAKSGPGVDEALDKTQSILSDIKVLSSELAAVAPQIAEVSESSRNVMHEADDVLRAAKQSILLRSNVPPYEEVLLDNLPRGERP